MKAMTKKITFIDMIWNRLKAKHPQLKGNPPYTGRAPGAGRTVVPPFKFKTLEQYKCYWAQEIGKTSKNIHS